MALFSICLHGMVSIGQVLMGGSADVVGAPLIAGICGSLLVLLALLLAVSLYRVAHQQDQ
jgi:hypothetical protein